ncbi:MAG: tRNA CCA-pyrophosphorylase [Thermoproteota archaeon]|nr:MAG: tRNA CCA-pyrophosphorylase [Candidatus Korarchaeota archaeon]
MSLMELLYPYVNVSLLVVRTTEQGKASMEGKPSELYADAVCCVYMSKADLEKLGVKEGKAVEVSTEAGSVAVVAKVDSELHEGLAYMPVGPWANAVTPVGGEVPPKAIAATVKKTDKKPMDVDKLFSAP